LAFTAQRGTEPPPRPRPAAARAARGGAAGLAILVPVYWLLGTMFAAIEVSTVAFAAAHGHKAWAGPVLGVYALGSAVGGLWYGARPRRSPLARRFLVTLGCMAAGVAAFPWQPGLASLSGTVFLAGLAIAP